MTVVVSLRNWKCTVKKDRGRERNGNQPSLMGEAVVVACGNLNAWESILGQTAVRLPRQYNNERGT